MCQERTDNVTDKKDVIYAKVGWTSEMLEGTFFRTLLGWANQVNFRKRFKRTTGSLFLTSLMEIEHNSQASEYSWCSVLNLADNEWCNRAFILFKLIGCKWFMISQSYSTALVNEPNLFCEDFWSDLEIPRMSTHLFLARVVLHDLLISVSLMLFRLDQC